MNRKFALGMVALLVLPGLAVICAIGEEVHVADVEEVSTFNVSTQFASMQAELDALRAQVSEISYAAGGGCGDCGKGGCGDCGAGCGCTCACGTGCSFWYAGADLVIAKPFFADGVERTVFIDDVNNTPTNGQTGNPFNYEATPRVYLGYERCDGLGLRVRWWQFDHEADPILAPTDDDVLNEDDDNIVADLETVTVDAELTQRLSVACTEVMLSGGFRYAKSEFGTARIEVGNPNDIFVLDSAFEGVGLTVAADVRRPILCNTALLGGVRGSFVYGDTTRSRINTSDVGTLTDVTVVEEEDDMIYILEAALGAEWARETSFGRLSLRAMAEAQLWGNGTMDQEVMNVNGSTTDAFGVFNHDQNFGFFGVSLGAMIER